MLSAKVGATRNYKLNLTLSILRILRNLRCLENLLVLGEVALPAIKLNLMILSKNKILLRWNSEKILMNECCKNILLVLAK